MALLVKFPQIAPVALSAFQPFTIATCPLRVARSIEATVFEEISVLALLSQIQIWVSRIKPRSDSSAIGLPLFAGALYQVAVYDHAVFHATEQSVRLISIRNQSGKWLAMFGDDYGEPTTIDFIN
jgi:hypothetical protein